jgi:Tfp pilus assembly pilus retraction ATPase PilT
MNNYMIVLRLLTAKTPNIKTLNLPDIYEKVCKVGQ